MCIMYMRSKSKTSYELLCSTLKVLHIYSYSNCTFTVRLPLTVQLQIFLYLIVMCHKIFELPSFKNNAAQSCLLIYKPKEIYKF